MNYFLKFEHNFNQLLDSITNAKKYSFISQLINY